MEPLEACGDKMRGPSVFELLRCPSETPAQELRVLSWMAYNLGDFVPTEDLCRIVAPEAKTVTQDMVNMVWTSVCRARTCLNEKEWRLCSLQSPSGYFLIPMVELQENEDRIVRLGNYRPIPDWITDKTLDKNDLIMLCGTTQIVSIGRGQDPQVAPLLWDYLYIQLMRLAQARVDGTSVFYNDLPGDYWSKIKKFLHTYDKVWNLCRTGDTIQLVKRE